MFQDSKVSFRSSRKIETFYAAESYKTVTVIVLLQSKYYSCVALDPYSFSKNIFYLKNTGRKAALIWTLLKSQTTKLELFVFQRECTTGHWNFASCMGWTQIAHLHFTEVLESHEQPNKTSKHAYSSTKHGLLMVRWFSPELLSVNRMLDRSGCTRWLTSKRCAKWWVCEGRGYHSVLALAMSRKLV